MCYKTVCIISKKIMTNKKRDIIFRRKQLAIDNRDSFFNIDTNRRKIYKYINIKNLWCSPLNKI